MWYPTDQGLVKTLSRSVNESPIRYSTMRSKAVRFKPVAPPTSDNLGPGSYDLPCLADVQRYRRTQGQLSSFKSTVPRLNPKSDPAKYLGSTWSPEHDGREWGRRGFHISQTKLRSPAYIPNFWS